MEEPFKSLVQIYYFLSKFASNLYKWLHLYKLEFNIRLLMPALFNYLRNVLQQVDQTSLFISESWYQQH